MSEIIHERSLCSYTIDDVEAELKDSEPISKCGRYEDLIGLPLHLQYIDTTVRVPGCSRIPLAGCFCLWIDTGVELHLGERFNLWIANDEYVDMGRYAHNAWGVRRFVREVSGQAGSDYPSPTYNSYGCVNKVVSQQGGVANYISRTPPPDPHGPLNGPYYGAGISSQSSGVSWTYNGITTGKLYLTCNDDYCGDNSGQFSVRIRKYPQEVFLKLAKEYLATAGPNDIQDHIRAT